MEARPESLAQQLQSEELSRQREQLLRLERLWAVTAAELGALKDGRATFRRFGKLFIKQDRQELVKAVNEKLEEAREHSRRLQKATDQGQ
ncbi:hypothetical protein WJX81_004429 [Elliptochloris bilobata]|uniref:Uncharacterized protein n=1 Tax=Elliptochloris bilobata TaxID=381761 RepID=A0AAW1RWK4_9CHLO